MHLGQYLYSEAILTGVRVNDRTALLNQLTTALMRTPIMREHTHLSAEKIQALLVEELGDGNIALDGGLALPHLRLDDFSGLGLAFAIMESPTILEGDGKEPVEVACLMILPNSHPTIGLKVMSQLARLMLDEDAHKTLANAKVPGDALRVLEPYFKIEDVITARDIMRKPKYAVYEDTPLRHVTRQIVFYGVEAIGVVDHGHRLVGQITCDDLFRFSLPEYFGHLKTVSFIRKFDPFEKYFEGESATLARDVMNSDFSEVHEDTTLLEVIFEFATKKFPKVFVVKDGVLVGIIDRQLVLDRVINF